MLYAAQQHLAAAYSGRTISGYLNGVRAWHILHGLRWSLEKQKTEAILRAADMLCFLSFCPIICRYVRLPPFLSPPSSHKGLMYSYDSILLIRFDLVTSCLVCNGHYNRTPDLGKGVMWWNTWDLARYTILDAKVLDRNVTWLTKHKDTS